MTKRMKSAMSSMIHSGSAAKALGTWAGSGRRRLIPGERGGGGAGSSGFLVITAGDVGSSPTDAAELQDSLNCSQSIFVVQIS